MFFVRGRPAILSCAVKLFATRGLAATNVADTAARDLERLPLTPRQKVEQAATTLMRTLEEYENFSWISVLISTAGISDAVPAETRAIIRRERDVPYGVVARLARAGQRDGSFDDGRPDDLPLIFWTTVKGLALHRLALGSTYKSPDPRILARIFFLETPT
ncbi:MAG TPA: hypothetical protein VGK32_17355 [Vicinamibacterales bacterium]|jgi:hypothetical protein